MEIIESIIGFFGLNPEIVTFTDFMLWFSKFIMAFLIVALCLKFMFQASWKIERSLR